MRRESPSINYMCAHVIMASLCRFQVAMSLGLANPPHAAGTEQKGKVGTGRSRAESRKRSRQRCRPPCSGSDPRRFPIIVDEHDTPQAWPRALAQHPEDWVL